MIAWFFIVLFSLPLIINTYNTMNIKDLKISQCDKIDYPVMVSNITVKLGTKPRVKVSGTLSTDVDLIGPIKAVVSLKRDIWGIWVHIPCEDNVGSCTYDNLCDHGYPKNVSCPDDFLKNNVPCRCPIPKGNYTILPSIQWSEQSSFLSGTYKGQVIVSQNGQSLTCYNIYFVLYDEADLYSVIQV